MAVGASLHCFSACFLIPEIDEVRGSKYQVGTKKLSYPGYKPKKLDYYLEVYFGGICPQCRAPGIPRLNFLDESLPPTARKHLENSWNQYARSLKRN